MNTFLEKHSEGIIALLVGSGVPLGIWAVRHYKQLIINEATLIVNRATKRIDRETSDITEKVIVINEKLSAVKDKQMDIVEEVRQDLESMNKSLQVLSSLKNELEVNKELFKLEHTYLMTKMEEIKTIISTSLQK